MTCPAMLCDTHYTVSQRNRQGPPVNQVRLTAADAEKNFRVTEASCEAGGAPRAAQAGDTPLRQLGGSACGARGEDCASERRMG